MAVKVIEAKRVPNKRSPEKEKKKLKVAAYARVSTESEEQESSYEAQVSHYTVLIKTNPDWEFAGIYADEGISGTQAKKRPEFLRMINDCEQGRIDMVIAKSISRWARNTLDSLTYIRKLKDLGIPVIFEKENINTMDASGELLLTIMASLAQQESLSISLNTKMGIRFKFQDGIGRLNTAIFLGLELGDKPGEYVINPEQAEVARRIYREYLEGYSPAMIAAHLNTDEIRTPSGEGLWYASSIASILSNEKYCGDMLFQKYFVEDFLTHKTIKNTGQLPQYYVEDHHDPIVPKKIFFQTQGELMRRGAMKDDPTKIRFGSTKALCRRLICPICGRPLKRVQRGNYVDWRCRYQNGTAVSNRRSTVSACGCRVVSEGEAEDAILTAFNKLPEMREELIRMQAAIQAGELKRIDSLMEQSKETETRLEERKVQADADGNEDEIGFLDLEITRCRYEREQLILERAEHASRELQIRFLLELLDDMRLDDDEREAPELHGACRKAEDFFRWTKHPIPDGLILNGQITRFDNDMVIRYLENVTVLDDGFEVNFKAGITVKV
ncbi:MAG: recombinase family protein [Clostridia bacterium]|nr:recombinase family protein [Clostridia bacterium]